MNKSHQQELTCLGLKSRNAEHIQEGNKWDISYITQNKNNLVLSGTFSKVVCHY